MPATISKGRLLSLLKDKGHETPGSVTFLEDTQKILLQEFGFSEDQKSLVKDSATAFVKQVKDRYKKQRRFDRIIDNSKVSACFVSVHTCIAIIVQLLGSSGSSSLCYLCCTSNIKGPITSYNVFLLDG